MPGKNGHAFEFLRRGFPRGDDACGIWLIINPRDFKDIIDGQPHSPQFIYLATFSRKYEMDFVCPSNTFSYSVWILKILGKRGQWTDTMTIIWEILTHFTYFEFLIFNYSLANIRHVLLIKDFVCTNLVCLAGIFEEDGNTADLLEFAKRISFPMKCRNVWALSLIDPENPIIYPWHFPDPILIRFVEGQNCINIWSDNWIPLFPKIRRFSGYFKSTFQFINLQGLHLPIFGQFFNFQLFIKKFGDFFLARNIFPYFGMMEIK